MKLINIAGYTSLIIVSVICSVYAWRMYQRYILKPLLFLFFFVLTYSAAGLLTIVGEYMAREVLGKWLRPEAPSDLITWVFLLLAYPFLIMAIYSFISMILSLGEYQFKKKYQVVFFLSQFVLIVFWFFIGYQSSIDNDHNIYNLKIIYSGFNLVVLLLLCFYLAYIWLGKVRYGYKDGIKSFVIIYAVMLVVHYLLMFLVDSFPLSCALNSIGAFFLHIPPLLYLNRFLRRFTDKQPLHPLENNLIKSVCDQYKITDREAEVIKLLLDGNSYRDIEDRLFISLKTVKSHIYNIYKKTRVSSRWQLLNLFQQSS